MKTRIERRRAQVGRWLMYPLIALAATALAGLATASPAWNDALDHAGGCSWNDAPAPCR